MSEVVDRARLEMLSGGDPEVGRQLVTLLLSEGRELADRIDAAFADPAAVVEAAHALKGIAGNVGAPRLAGAARDLEEATRSGGAEARRTARDAVRAALADLEAAISPSRRSR